MRRREANGAISWSLVQGGLGMCCGAQINNPNYNASLPRACDASSAMTKAKYCCLVWGLVKLGSGPIQFLADQLIG